MYIIYCGISEEIKGNDREREGETRVPNLKGLFAE
jgi:hypothetical protein